MKISAIRVRDTGHFSAPTALEGLSGGLDVLAAGNEAGKSTLFRALEAAFYEKHTATGGRVKGITPRGGGSPLVEVDFSVNGNAWRITKQFGRGRRAALSPLGGGGSELRGADADEALARLVGISDGVRGSFLPGRFGFLWVGQGGALEPAPPQAERGETAALRKIVEREVSAVTGGSLVRRLRAEAGEELAKLKTPAHHRAKANGPWDLAIKRAAEVERAHVAAVAARTASGQRREAIAGLRARRLELLAPQRVAASRQALADAMAARDAAAGARRLLREVVARAETQEAALRDAERAVLEMRTRLDEAAALDLAVAAGGPRLAAAEEALAAHKAEADAIAAEGERLRSEEATALAEVHAAEQAAMAAQARSRLIQLEASLETARALEAQIAVALASVAGLSVNAAAIDGLVEADAAFKRACDALEAGAPRITIAYESDAARPIMHDGVPAGEGLMPVVDGVVRLVIPGVGVIEIAAAATADRAKHLAARDGARAALDQGLALIGVRELAAAQTRYREGVAAVSALEALQARMSGLAPRGVGGLEADADAVRESLGRSASGGEGVPDRAVAVARLEQVKAALDALRGAYRIKQAGLEPLVAAAERERDGLERGRARLAALALELPTVEARAPALAELSAQAASVRAATSGALRELAAVRATVPDEDEVAGLEARVRTLQAQQAQDAAEVQQNEVLCARLEGEEGLADQDGLAARVQEFEGDLVRAKAEVARLEADVAAYSLLVDTIDAAENDNLDRYLVPVVRLLNPMLDGVFPGARLRLGTDFSVGGLERSGAAGDLDILSGGTREQIAVLVRLAFAGLLAEAGHAAPLILDDALVYSDDERLARIFQALTAGAGKHQVIVLTCHKHAFDALGGNRAGLVAWADCL